METKIARSTGKAGTDTDGAFESPEPVELLPPPEEPPPSVPLDPDPDPDPDPDSDPVRVSLNFSMMKLTASIV